MSLLQTRDLVHVYPGNVRALDGLSLSIERGRRLAILGPNGAGKSTMLLHLNGTLQPQSGQVILGGDVMRYDSASLTAWRKRVGLVLQNADDQLFAATVFEDVSFGPLNMGLNDRDAEIRVLEALAAMDISDLADRSTHMLSGGQKRRVAIAGLVAMRPEVLLLDEPTAGLDHNGTENLLVLLEELERKGATLVFTTHDVDLAYRFADDVALFDGGRILAQGPATEILSDPELVDKAKLASPFLLQLGLRARSLGILSPTAPMPRTNAGGLDLLDFAAPRKAAAARAPARTVTKKP